MPVSQYPTHVNLSGDTNVIGPQPAKLIPVPPEFAGTQKIFKDKGASYGLATTSQVLVWEFTYTRMTPAQWAVLLAHWVEAQGTFGGFNFRHPYTGVLYSDVHYRSINYDHTKSWSNFADIVLEKRPA